MANIVFRLPGHEQYSFAEVTVTSEEYYAEGPDSVSDLLLKALTDLNAAFPQSDARPAQQAPQDARPAAPAATTGLSCEHGPRKHHAGVSARGPYQAYFCPQPKGPTQCDPVWLKQGQPGWVY